MKLPNFVTKKLNKMSRAKVKKFTKGYFNDFAQKLQDETLLVLAKEIEKAIDNNDTKSFDLATQNFKYRAARLEVWSNRIKKVNLKKHPKLQKLLTR